MTAAGLNCSINIWRFDQKDDDDVGGAIYSGTLRYTKIPCRIQAQPIEQVLLQQGLETNKTFDAIIVPGTLAVYERDEIEVIAPCDHPYYKDKFRVESVRYSDNNPRDPRAYIMLTLTRSVLAHAQQ